jgi:hypothetical protein
VEQAAGELAALGERLNETARRLPHTGNPPVAALPGGRVVQALSLATHAIARDVSTQGTTTGSAAERVRAFVAAVRTAETEAAADLEGSGS